MRESNTFIRITTRNIDREKKNKRMEFIQDTFFQC